MRNKNMKAGVLSEKKILITILFIAVFMRCFLLMVFMYTKNYTIKDSGLIEYDQYIYYNSAINLSEGKGYAISFTDQEQHKVKYTMRLNHLQYLEHIITIFILLYIHSF